MFSVIFYLINQKMDTTPSDSMGVGSHVSPSKRKERTHTERGTTRPNKTVEEPDEEQCFNRDVRLGHFCCGYTEPDKEVTKTITKTS